MEIDSSKQELIERLGKHLRWDIRYELPPPVIIEFTGSPESGKTTCIKTLYSDLRKFGCRISMPQEGAEVVNYVPRTSPEYNLATFNYALNWLLKYYHIPTCDIAIFDRCIFDPYFWMEYWDNKKSFYRDEKRLYQSMALSRFWTEKIDACIIMVCEPEEAMRRAKRLSMTNRIGGTTNPKDLQVLVDRYRNGYDNLKGRYSQLHLVDTTRLNEHQMLDEVSKIVFDIFKRRTSR